MADTIKASVITDHPFEPRVDVTGPRGSIYQLQPSPYLCQHCRMAEAAHRETTVKR